MFGSKIQGGAQLSAALRQLSPRQERGILNTMLKNAAEPMAERMGELAPVEAGKPDLADNIVIQSISAKEVGDAEIGGMRMREETEAVVAVGPAKPFFYGFFQEFGTLKHGAQPFARPAFDTTHLASLKRFQESIWAWLRTRADRGRSTTGRGL